MNKSLLKTFAFCCVLSLFFSGCHSGGNNNPSPTPSPSNISGDYTGTMTDTQSGSGSATATLAQNGSTAGGAITASLTSATVTAQVALNISPSNALTGSMVIDFANGTTCTFSTTGTYSNDGTTAVINGAYTAVSNCSGDSGTFVLNQQCTDSISGIDRRVMSFPAKC